MGTRFGERLRRERLERGLTHDQLSRDLCPPGLISLLETGRREPSCELVRSLAGRLAPAPPGPGALLAALRAEQAWDEHDYAQSASNALAAAQLALAAGDRLTRWDLSCLQAECLMSQGHPRESKHILDRLVEDAPAPDPAGTELRCRTLLAEACTALGEHAEAIAHAREALRLATSHPAHPAQQAAAIRALATALAEADDTDEAWAHCRSLEHLLDAGLPARAAGEAHWTIGNIAVLGGESGRATAHHQRAAELLMPLQDMQLWARFNLDASAARLSLGIADSFTLAMIEQAETALAATGGSPLEHLHATLNRAQWLYLRGGIAEAAR
ncbi:helix-turn-helix domain-containing protein [Sinomonas sp. G460-2]|uniref:helix-turn-helix domain-containing protein n=1 Tax=Sinomonas sp. G460-2 TaxID=3393464 RepID=UPI0039F09AAC